jgi:hypothetical protein
MDLANNLPRFRANPSRGVRVQGGEGGATAAKKIELHRRCKSTAVQTDMNVTSFGRRPQPELAPPSSGPIASTPAVAATEQDHYAALARMVGEVSQDHAQLRMFIYEYVRLKLRKELYPLFLDGCWSAIEQQTRALEGAIGRIETDFAQNAAPLRYSLQSSLPQSDETSRSLTSFSPNISKASTFGDQGIDTRSYVSSSSFDSSALVSDSHDRSPHAVLARHLRSPFWRNTQLVLAAVIGLAIFAAIDLQSVQNRFGFRLGLGLPNRSPQINAADTKQSVAGERESSTVISDDTARPRPAEIPTPSDYGAYAVLNGKLTELAQLPIKVPDPRVAISAPITVPGQAHLSYGQLQFIVFRRDLKDNAPDRVSVRVVAQVMRALTFDSKGHAKTTDVDQSWVIRNHSYQMRVAPFGDNPEMIVIRSDPGDFVFPAGRYALVLRGVGYDFTVEGEVTDLAHCLERTDALNAPVYSECRKL